MLDVFGLFSVPTLYVLIGISVLLIVAIILSIVAIAKSSAMKKKYNIMMEGSEGKSIEKIIKEYTDDVKLLKETYENNTKSIKDIYDKMQYTFQKVGIVKYDAFHEMGGKLSFAYIKEIINGESFIELGDEEANALKQAVAGRMGDVELSREVNDIVNN